MSEVDVVVVGGGIVGMSCAYYCASAGMSVCVVEEGIVGGGATGAGMGHLVVLDGSEAEFALCHYSLKLWAELAPHIGERIEMDPCGTLWVIEDDASWAAAEAKRSFYTDRGVEATLVSSAELAVLEPNLRSGLKGALLVPGDSVIYAPKACRALWEMARDLGAKLSAGRVARAEQGQVSLTDGTTISGKAVVVANGLGAPELIPGLPIRPKKGHLLITDRHPGFMRHQTLELGYLASAHGTESESVAFNIQPRLNGQMLIGSSRQWDVASADVEMPILSQMLARAASFVPSVRALSAIRSWTGLRPATPDSLPLIDRVTDGLYVAAGHEGLGITTSLGTGKALADSLSGQQPQIDLKAFAVARFGVGAR